MIRLVYDGDSCTGALERRYVVGTRKLDDARTVRLARGSGRGGVRPQDEWCGIVVRGVDPDGRRSETAAAATAAVRDSGVLEGLVEWDEAALTAAPVFRIRQRDVREALRRLISVPAEGSASG